MEVRKQSLKVHAVLEHALHRNDARLHGLFLHRHDAEAVADELIKKPGHGYVCILQKKVVGASRLVPVPPRLGDSQNVVK